MIPAREIMMMPYSCYHAFLNFVGISMADLYVIKVFLVGAAIGSGTMYLLS